MIRRIAAITICICMLLCLPVYAEDPCETAESSSASSVAGTDDALPASDELLPDRGILPIDFGKITEAVISRSKDLAIKHLINNMSLREKVGQLFIIRPDSLGITDSVDTAAASLYEKYPAGGFCLFAKNIRDPKQLVKLNSGLHKLGKLSPIIFTDEEGGSVSRVANNRNFDVEKFSNMQSVAASGDSQDAYDVGFTIGSYLVKYGLDGSFAPVADVNTNPENPVIGSRAFGTDPLIAAAMVKRTVEGFCDAGCISCLKHYPGHGDTDSDTHKGTASTDKSWDEIKSCEMVPFISGINSGCQVVMAAHISAPAVTGSDEPASLSYCLITEKLRQELGFEGVIITDSMEMKAISAEYSSAQAAVLAINAGCDIVLMPVDYKAAFDGVVNAVLSNKISARRLDESVERILKLKSGLY